MSKKTVLCTLMLLVVIITNSLACVTCNRPLQTAIAENAGSFRLIEIFTPFIILGIIVGVLWYKAFSLKIHKVENTKTPLVFSSAVVGIGLGGFFDGILLHQILQWHEMLSNKVPPNTLLAKSVNMFWDGIFHAFTLLVTIIGVCMLYKLLYRKKRIAIHRNLFVGGLFIGWAIFNLVEGVLNHHIFELHYVNDLSPNYILWNYGFLVVSVLMFVIGYALTKRSPRHIINKD